jgi:hypothetical protein
MGDVPIPHTSNRDLYKNYPVDLFAMRIDWILEGGLPFLEAIMTAENLLKDRGLK